MGAPHARLPLRWPLVRFLSLDVVCVVCVVPCVVLCVVLCAVTNTTYTLAHSPAAVAVAVVRDGARPTLSASARPREFVDLLQACWHQDPTARPSFFVRAPAPRNATHAVLLMWQHVTCDMWAACRRP